MAFVIAGAGAGLAGALMANFAKFVSPDMLHWSRSGELMIMVILGGAARVVSATPRFTTTARTPVMLSEASSGKRLRRSGGVE